MTITIYDQKGLITSHYVNVNMVIAHSDGSISIYHDWDGVSFARDDYAKDEYSWYSVESK